MGSVIWCFSLTYKKKKKQNKNMIIVKRDVLDEDFGETVLYLVV